MAASFVPEDPTTSSLYHHGYHTGLGRSGPQPRLHGRDLPPGEALIVAVEELETAGAYEVVEFKKDFEMDALRAALASAPGIIVEDDPANNKYPMPIFAQDTDEVWVGRIRRDESVRSGINMWVVADNIRKGAATNAVQIAQALIRMWEAE